MAKTVKIIVCLITFFVCLVVVSIRIENNQLSAIKSIEVYQDVKAGYSYLVTMEKELCIENKKYKAVYLRPEFPSLPSGCRVLIFNDIDDCVDRTFDISQDKGFEIRWRLVTTNDSKNIQHLIPR